METRPSETVLWLWVLPRYQRPGASKRLCMSKAYHERVGSVGVWVCGSTRDPGFSGTCRTGLNPEPPPHPYSHTPILPLRPVDIRGALWIPGNLEAPLAGGADGMAELPLEPVIAVLLAAVHQRHVALVVPEPADLVFLLLERERNAEVAGGDRRRVRLADGREDVLPAGRVEFQGEAGDAVLRALDVVGRGDEEPVRADAHLLVGKPHLLFFEG